MKPRIFISSTFYDLKYIREDLASFVRAYDYEPVLFEDGDIGYTPGKNLDASCYEAMRNSDMVILIIGGEYGSAAGGEKKDDFREYLSVTRSEFRTAVESGIPIFVMIDKKVMAEYGVYEANYDSIEKDNNKMNFPSTKNINVFRFIKEVRSIVTLPVQEFEKSADIKGFIRKQWADMFKNYLSSLRNKTEQNKIENSVNEMKALIQKMNIMLDSVGKNVLKENPEEYEDVINKQRILGFCDTLIQTFKWREDDIDCAFDKRREFIAKLLDCLLELNEYGLLDNHIVFDDKGNVTDFMYIFRRHKIKAPSEVYDMRNIKEKITLLTDNQNRNLITGTLVQDKYFVQLIEV